MRRSFHSNMAFLDILFNMLICFAAFFAIAVVFMSQTKDPADIELSAYIMIIATWPGEFNDDVDLYIRDPSGEVVFFRNKSNSLMHLDRDDVGNNEDIDSEDKPINREIIMIRKKLKGEYVVNAHMYAKYSEIPLPVDVKIVRISPRRSIHESTLIFDEAHQEQTICRFTVIEKGKISDVHHRQIEIARPILVASP